MCQQALRLSRVGQKGKCTVFRQADCKDAAPATRWPCWEKLYQSTQVSHGDCSLVLRCAVLCCSRRDPDAHKKFLKPSPLASELVDRCIECGFCESNCPSRDITLTPRCATQVAAVFCAVCTAIQCAPKKVYTRQGGDGLCTAAVLLVCTSTVLQVCAAAVLVNLLASESYLCVFSQAQCAGVG